MTWIKEKGKEDNRGHPVNAQELEDISQVRRQKKIQGAPRHDALLSSRQPEDGVIAPGALSTSWDIFE
eukprot:12498080-Ditylum_brightwellii.AAC.1